MRSSAEMWWTGVIGASEYMNCIAQSLEKKNSILMFIPQKIPWHSSFMEHIRTLNPNRNIMSFNLIDCLSVKNDDLGLLLLNRFGSSEQIKNSKGHTSIMEYLAEESILKNRTIWLYNVPERFENKWIKSIFEYECKTDNIDTRAILCMEIGYMDRLSVNSSVIDVISWESHIFNYDVLMFAMHRVRNINESEYIKTYVSKIASGIASLDIELCDALINNYYRLIRNPERTVQSVCNEIYTSDKAKIFHMSRREFTYILWSAQEQVLFPIIEKQRLDFIKKYYHIVSANFQKAKEIQTINLDNTMDMELGTLIDICNKGLEGTNEIKSNTTDWIMLKDLRHARNKIAHRQPVDFELFYKIVNCNFL